MRRSIDGTLRRRRQPAICDVVESNDSDRDFGDDEHCEEEESHKLTLMEELLLLSLKDEAGYSSFWNEMISTVIRGALLIDMSFQGRIGLESKRRKALYDYTVVSKSSNTNCNDALMSEALKHIRGSSYSVGQWILYLSGDTWDMRKIKYQLKQVRERLAKNLTEKGVLSTSVQNFVVFDMTTHPVIDKELKKELITNIQQALLSRKCHRKIQKRLLALIYLAYWADIFNQILDPLNDDDYDIANERLNELMAIDFNEEYKKAGENEVMYAVLSYFADNSSSYF